MDRDPTSDVADSRAPTIDWNEAWQAARRNSTRSGKEVWDRRAPGFARSAAKSGYVDRMLELMSPEPDWTVLDVGCGSGTLALPLARRVQSVTALDFSPRMLEQLRCRSAAAGIANVRTVLGAWEDDWAALGVGTCDVALASRSLTVDDLRGAILKLHRVARRRVYVTSPAGAHPINRRVVEAAGRRFVPGPDYIYPYALLHQLGIFASVTLVPVSDARRFASVHDALEGLRWMVPDPSPVEVDRLRAWLERELVPDGDGMTLSAGCKIQWAVISWSTSPAHADGARR